MWILTFVVLTLLPVLQLHPVRSGRTLHSSPSIHGCIWHHHFWATMEAGGNRDENVRISIPLPFDASDVCTLDQFLVCFCWQPSTHLTKALRRLQQHYTVCHILYILHKFRCTLHRDHPTGVFSMKGGNITSHQHMDCTWELVEDSERIIKCYLRLFSFLL